LEIEVQFKASEPGERLRQTMPGDASEDGVVRPAGIGYLHRAATDVDDRLSPDKMAIDSLGVALLESPELFGQHTVEGVGDHGHQNVKVHLHQDRGRQGVKVEKLDRLGEVDLAGFELIPQQVNIRNGISKTLCHGLRRQAIHEGGPEGFVSLLPFVDRVDNIVGIVHE